MGWNAQPTAQVIFEGVRVPADAMLGGADGEGTGFGIAMNGLNGGRINIAACSLGGAQAAYDKAASYLADRQAFGGALLDEPTIRFTLADMATALETSRTLLWRAATALDDDHPDKVELCAMAKRYVTDACFDVADQALQLHGGYGYLREYGLEKIVRDLRVHRILEGTNEIMRVVIGRAEAARARALRIGRRSQTMTTIAFLGLGNMGGPMAANLVAAGHTVRGFDPVPALQGGRRRQGRHGLRHRRRRGGRRRRGDHLAAQRRHRQGLLRRGAARGEGRRAVHRHVDDLGRRRPRHPRAGHRTRLRPTRRPGVRRRQGRDRGHAGVHGRRRGRRRRARPPGAGTDGGQDHSLRRLRQRARAAKLCNNMVLAVQQIAVGEAFVLAEKLGLSAQSLFDVITGATGNCWAVHTNCPVPGPVPTSPANNDFKPGFATALMNKDLGLAMDAVTSTGSSAPLGSHAAEIYAEVRRRPRRQGLQRGHRTATRQLTSSTSGCVGRLARCIPTAMQPLAVRDPHRLSARVIRAHRNRGGDVRRTVAGDDHGGQTRGGRRPQPRGRTRDGERVLRGYPELPQCGSESLGIRHGLLDIVGGHHRFDDTVADQLSHQRLRPASLATCDDADRRRRR